MNRSTLGGVGLVASVLFGCTGTVAPVPATTPAGSQPTVQAPSSPPPPRTEQVPAPPAICAAFLGAAPAADCPASEDRLVRLDAAMSAPKTEQRDAALRTLEACPVFESGLLRALRAELAPNECADAIVGPWLEQPPPGLSLEVSQVLVGLALSSKLARTSAQPPSIGEHLDKAHFLEVLRERLQPWFQMQAREIETLASEGARLSGYAKAIAAIAAGRADLRFVESVRRVSLPAELKGDQELSEVYGQALEEALEPRKRRGRDALLVGLLHLAQAGVLHDSRLVQARQLLSRAYSGSRLTTLDLLLLPELPPLVVETPEQRLAAALPTFYAGRLLDPRLSLDASVLRALLDNGIPPEARRQLEGAAQLTPPVANLYARGLVELGMRYFRPGDFSRAAEVAAQAAHIPGTARAENQFLSALAQALRGGPENAIELFLTGPMLPSTMGDTSALDAISKRPGPYAGMAAFDAAHILSFLPQSEPTPLRWRKIAARFERAARLLAQPMQRTRALARARDAKATAEEIAEGVANPPPAEAQAP